MDDDTQSTGDEPSSTDETAFDIPVRPERNYTPTGGVEYAGGTVFHLEPDPALSAAELETVVADLLAADRYVQGDWFDLPRPVYLVHDRTVSTSFRVVIRSGRLELHVLPSTDPAGLRTLYDRLQEETDADWTVRSRVEQA